MLVTIPKAGTYFVYEILKGLGLAESYTHVRYDDKFIGLYHFRFVPKEIHRTSPEIVFYKMTFQDVLDRINPGEFAVGHLPPTPEVKGPLSDSFKIIFLVRDLKHCLVSHMRFMIQSTRIKESEHPWIRISDPKAKFINYLLNYAEPCGPLTQMKQVACWEYVIRNPHPNMEIIKIRHEDLIHSDKSISRQALQSLCDFLQIGRKTDPESILNKALGEKTVTKSEGKSSKYEDYWSPFAEQWFSKNILIGDENINKLMGY